MRSRIVKHLLQYLRLPGRGAVPYVFRVSLRWYAVVIDCHDVAALSRW
jgi:hypothetical protein